VAKYYYVPKRMLAALLTKREEVSTSAPTETEALAWLDCADPDKSIAPLAQLRPAQSFKGFFLAASESVGRYGSQAEAATAVHARRAGPCQKRHDAGVVPRLQAHDCYPRTMGRVVK
jgi:hypothetical protein